VSALTAFAGGTLFGERFGDPARPPSVLALHGWARSHVDFGATLRGLDAVALDLPGSGATPSPPEAWGAEAYARAVAKVLPALAPRVVVLGHSFGGRVAVHLAVQAPDRVAALVLTGVPLLRVGPAARRRPPVAYRVARSLHARGVIGDARMERWRTRYGSADYMAARGVMRDVLVRAVNESYEEQLRAVACHVELVWGDNDPQVPVSVAEAAAIMLADARLTICAGAGHDTPRTIPDVLRAAVERALAT
jgi:pimeloyl-ACP methyl ester carboxylesterase